MAAHFLFRLENFMKLTAAEEDKTLGFLCTFQELSSWSEMINIRHSKQLFDVSKVLVKTDQSQAM